MRAVTVKQPGDTRQLQFTEQPKPIPKQGEILIKVHAAAINRTDILTRQFGSTYMNHPILGVEVAGTIAACGADVHMEPGTRVMGLVNGGGYAEYAVMPADRAMLIPENMSFTDAAAIPEVFLTAYQTLFLLAKLTKNETVLIHAGGSGVGTAAIQLAKQLAQAKVITTAGSQVKLHMCSSLGADVCINYKETDFADEVLRATDEKGVDVILDFVGASYWEKNLRSITTDGRWIVIGLLGGSTVEKVNLMRLMSKRIQLTGTLLTPRSDAYKAALTGEFVLKALPLFQEGQLKPVIDKVFPLKEVAGAHEHMESNQNIGKIILSLLD